MLSQDYTMGITKDFLYYSIMKNGKKKIIKKNNNLTLEQIRNEFRNIDYYNYYKHSGGRNYKNVILENRKIPPFCFLYYYLLIRHEKIPTPQEMVNKYIKFFCEKDEYGYYIKDNFSECAKFYFNLKALTGRICRAYNSFNREIDLLLRLFQEDDIKAKYSFYLDYYKGIDISIEYNGQKKGLACYQNSKRAEKFYELKHTTRRDDGDNIIIPIAMNKENSIFIGDIMLFSQKTYNNLIKEIKGENKYE